MLKKSVRKFVSICVAFAICISIGLGVLPGAQIGVQAASTLTIVQSTPGNIFYEADTKSFTVNTNGDLVTWSYTDYWGNAQGNRMKKISGKKEKNLLCSCESMEEL